MRGKKINDDIKEQARALLLTNNNVQFVADALNLPYTTIETWRNKWMREDDEFVELRKKRKEDFVNKSWDIIELCQERIREQLEDKDTRLDIGKLSSTLGVSFDKQALASDEATANVKVSGEIKFEDIEE